MGVQTGGPAAASPTRHQHNRCHSEEYGAGLDSTCPPELRQGDHSDQPTGDSRKHQPPHVEGPGTHLGRGSYFP